MPLYLFSTTLSTLPLQSYCSALSTKDYRDRSCWTWSFVSNCSFAFHHYLTAFELMLAAFLCAIFACIGINSPSMDTYDANRLLQKILIFKSNFWKCLLFLIGCVRQLHWLIIPPNNNIIILPYSWIFFHLRVDLQNRKKNFSTWNRNYFVLSKCAFAKL